MSIPKERSKALRVSAWPAFANKTGNPYNRLLYEVVEGQGVRVEEFSVGRFLRRRYDVWHIHWPEGLARGTPIRSFLGKRLLFALLTMARVRGTRVVWTAHNVVAHDAEGRPGEVAFWRRFIARVDAIISLSHAALEELARTYPAVESKPVFVVPHGHYRSIVGTVPSRENARRALSLPPSGPVVAYVGAIRPYKNVPALIDAFAALDDAQMRLLIAGRAYGESLRQELSRKASEDERVRLMLGYQTDDVLAQIVAASDVVVLPYRSILNSGTALFALSCDRPVVVPEVGSMPELQETVGEEWVYTYGGAFGEGTLRDALQWVRNRPRATRPSLERLEWDHAAERTVEVYRSLQR